MWRWLWKRERYQWRGLIFSNGLVYVDTEVQMSGDNYVVQQRWVDVYIWSPTCKSAGYHHIEVVRHHRLFLDFNYGFTCFVLWIVISPIHVYQVHEEVCSPLLGSNWDDSDSITMGSSSPPCQHPHSTVQPAEETHTMTLIGITMRMEPLKTQNSY